MDIEKALSEDPNIFDYDGVYDDMVKKKEEKNERFLSKKDSRVSGMKEKLLVFTLSPAQIHRQLTSVVFILFPAQIHR